jgi:hypothetical protein
MTDLIRLLRDDESSRLHVVPIDEAKDFVGRGINLHEVADTTCHCDPAHHTFDGYQEVVVHRPLR